MHNPNSFSQSCRHLLNCYRAAVRAEYVYNRLAIDEKGLEISVIAAECAEVRSNVLCEIRDHCIDHQIELPFFRNLELRKEWVELGSSASPNLSLSNHFRALRAADRTLLKSLDLCELGELKDQIRNSGRKLFNYCRPYEGQPHHHGNQRPKKVVSFGSGSGKLLKAAC